MKRRAYAAALVVFLAVGGVAAANQVRPPSDTVEVSRAELEAMRDQINGWLETTATTRPDPVTTTRPDPVTTTRPTTTSTTRPTPTTTTRPVPTTLPTTTTAPPPFVLPPTIPHPDRVADAVGFIVNVKGKIVGCSQNSGPECGPELTYWDAGYLYDLPYSSGDNGWRDGDRQGYGCLYGGLQSDQVQIGGVRFVQIEAPRTATGFYGIIKDEGMDESEKPPLAYNFGGVLQDGRFVGECIDTDIDYSTLVPGPDIRSFRIGYLDCEDDVVEIRDYNTVNALDGVVLNVFEVDMDGTTITVASGTYTLPQQVIVVAFYQGRPQHAIYYYSFGCGHLIFEP